MKITFISIHRGTVPIVLFTVLILVGLYSATKMNYALLPDINTPTILVSTIYPGAGPNEVEKTVTIPIEKILGSMEGVEELSSKSMEGVSITAITLSLNSDVDIAIQEASRKLDRIMRDLPKDIYKPSLEKFNINALPIFIAGVNSNLTEADFYDLVRDNIQPELNNIKGVARVDLVGGVEREIKAMVNPDKIEAYNLNLLHVCKMIEYANMEFPTGKLETNSSVINIRLSGKLKSVEDLKKVVVGGAKDGTIIRLKDIADVHEGLTEPEKLARINGQETIGIEIIKQKEANSVEMSRLLREKIVQLEERYQRNNLKFEIADDQSRFTLQAAEAVKHDLILAIILVSAIMLFFLQSLRNSIFVLVAIPVSLISTFTAMFLFGFTFDLISLTSLSLVVGSLVDDAIVVIENIYRHMEMGKKRLHASFDAVQELGLTVTAITLVLVAVFLPIAFVTGIVGDILREYAVTIVVSMLFSLLVSFTLVPYMTARWAKLATPKNNLMGKLLKGFEKIIDITCAGVVVAMKWALNHKILTSLLTLGLFFSTLCLLPAGYIGTEFTAAGDRGSFLIRLEHSHNISLSENNRITRLAEQIILSYNEVDLVYATVGKKSGLATTTTTPYFSEISVNMVPKYQRNISTNIFARRVRARLEEQLLGAKVKAVAVSIMGNEDIALEYFVTGANADSVNSYAEQVFKCLQNTKGTIETEIGVQKSDSEYNIVVNRIKMAKLGLNLSEVGAILNYSFKGNNKNKFRNGNNEYDINVILDANDRRVKSDLEQLNFRSATSGEQIKLSQFAVVEESVGPSSLERFNRNPSVKVTSQILGVSQGEVQEAFFKNLKEIPAPQGVSVLKSQKTRLMEESFKDLGLAFIAAIIFVYLIMVVLYNNWLDPLVVMFSIPLAIIGALWALALSNLTLNIFSILGIVMLAGLVAKNAILVVDFINERMNNGSTLMQAIEEAVRLRFRPIVMTNVSMIIGLFPLALSQSEGSEWKNGIGWTLIGGLTVSMFLSMIIVPMIYYVFKKLQLRFGNTSN